MVPFVIDAGPETTANETSSPLDAVAASATALVASWSPMAGKEIACADGETTSTPDAEPS